MLSSLNKQPDPVELDSNPVQIPSKSKPVPQISAESESAVAIIDKKATTVPQIPSLPPTTQTVEKPPKKLSSKTNNQETNKNETVISKPKSVETTKIETKESSKSAEDEFENMGYISGDEGYTAMDKAIQPPAPIITEAASEEELEPVKLKFHFKLIFFKKCISYHFIKEFEREFYMTLLLSRQKILQG